MGARHSKHRKYPVQPSGLHISSPYPPGRSGFEEPAVTRNNPLFASGGGGGGGGRDSRGSSGVYRTYGNRPAPPPEEEAEDLDQAPLRPEERLRRSIIRSRRGQGHRSARREAREDHESRGGREERHPREDREDSVGEQLSVRSSTHSSARSSARSSVRSSQVRAKASVHSFEFPGPPAGDPDEECPYDRQKEELSVTILRQSQEEEDSAPIPRPAPRTLFGMMPDVVGRPAAPPAKDSSDDPVPGKVTIEVAWRGEDETHGRSQSSNPAGPDDLLSKTVYPNGSPNGSERGSISSGRFGGISVARSGGSSDRGSGRGVSDKSERGSLGGSPVSGSLDPPLTETWSTDGKTTNVPVTAETGTATGGGGGGGGGGTAQDRRRTVRWGDDAADLPARIEGEFTVRRDATLKITARLFSCATLFEEVNNWPYSRIIRQINVLCLYT